MSIKATVELITEEIEDKIINEIVVKKKEKKNYGMSKFKSKIEECVRPYRSTDDAIYLPFKWALDNLPNIKRKERSDCSPIDCKFILELRDVQREVKGDCIKALNRFWCHLISLYPGCGKTFLSIYLACKYSLKTLIIAHRVVLFEQWVEAIEEATGGLATFSVLKPDCKKNNFEADFLIVNAQNIKKFKPGTFDQVGFVIIDEVHAIMAELLSECLQFVSPRYLVGLSATLYRPDGLDGLLDFYFGKDNKTVRELYHPHIVYKINTSIEYEEDSKTQWSSLLTTQCTNTDRNDFVIKIVQQFKERHFLLLCQRVEQVSYILKKFEEVGESATGVEKGKFDKNARIIVAGFQKVGFGFSHKILDTLMFVADIISSDTSEYMVQYMARVMRTPDVKPIIFDIVDNHKTLKGHFNIRKIEYVKAGGTIIDFYKHFPLFDRI